MQLLTIYSAFLATFLSTALMVWLLAKYASHIKLVADPGEHRQHQTPTPTVGGIAIFGGLSLSLLFDSSNLNIFVCLGLLCAVGALDDRFALPSWSRFLAQGCAAYLMIHLSGVSLLSLGELVSPGASVLLGQWSTPMTIFAVIGVINAVNMSDGLDGLAGSLVMLALGALLFLSHPSSNLILAALGAIVGFLVWNLRIGRVAAKVFMGDAGSTMLGLLLAYLLIDFSQSNSAIAPVTALWLIALPLIDAVSVLIVRPIRGRSPFAADRAHYHHQLLDRGLTVNQTLLSALAVQAVFIGIGMLLNQYAVPDYLQLRLFLSFFAFYLLSLFWFTGKSS